MTSSGYRPRYAGWFTKATAVLALVLTSGCASKGRVSFASDFQAQRPQIVECDVAGVPTECACEPLGDHAEKLELLEAYCIAFGGTEEDCGVTD